MFKSIYNHTMSVLLLLFLFCVIVNSAPVEENIKEDNAKENETILEHKGEQSRAGIIDTLNPFSNNKENSEQSPDKNKDNEQNGSPLAPIQNFFSGTNNPFGQLFSSQPGSNNMLDNIKIFMVGSQGMVMPASAVLGGFQNFMETLGNAGSFVQGAQNLLPTLPAPGT